MTEIAGEGTATTTVSELLFGPSGSSVLQWEVAFYIRHNFRQTDSITLSATHRWYEHELAANQQFRSHVREIHSHFSGSCYLSHSYDFILAINRATIPDEALTKIQNRNACIQTYREKILNSLVSAAMKNSAVRQSGLSRGQVEMLMKQLNNEYRFEFEDDFYISAKHVIGLLKNKM
jgi:hypothetical protein